METGIGCRSERRHSCDPSMQSDPACPAPDIPSRGRHSGAGEKQVSERTILGFPRCRVPVTFTDLQKCWSWQLPQHQDALSYDSTHHTGHKSLSTSCLQGWAPFSLSISQAPAADTVPGPSQATWMKCIQKKR